jgi:hypothetical protein
MGHAEIALAAASDAEGKVQQRVHARTVGIGKQQARLKIVCRHSDVHTSEHMPP